MKNLQNKRLITQTPEELKKFEDVVSSTFEAGKIRAPIHLTGGNERELISIFEYVDVNDWVFSTWRSHYHALLHGIDSNWLMKEIIEGRSITIHNLEHNFFTSAIVGGTLPIAVGTAMGLRRAKEKKMVWVFIGDMTAESGVFYEALKFSKKNELPIMFVIEDNGMSTNTPTQDAWGDPENNTSKTLQWLTDINGSANPKKLTENVYLYGDNVIYYKYQRQYPHTGTGKWVYF